jgi:hypothetical protein
MFYLNVQRSAFNSMFDVQDPSAVDGSGNGYLKSVCDYVHLNPVRAGLLGPEQPLEDYPWSSYGLYVRDTSPRPMWLRVDRLMGEWGIRWDVPDVGGQFSAVMEARRRAEAREEYEPVTRMWCYGSEPFRQEMLQHIEQQQGRWHYGGGSRRIGPSQGRTACESNSNRGYFESGRLNSRYPRCAFST